MKNKLFCRVSAFLAERFRLSLSGSLSKFLSELAIGVSKGFTMSFNL